MTDRIGYNWGDASPLNPSLGFGGAHLNMRVLELSFDVDQDGVFSSGFNWTPYSIFSVDPDVREIGWSFPTPIFQLGELYTPRGTYGTFALGREVLGVSVGVHFGVHKDNPTNGMAASEKVHPRFDHQGNVIGTVLEEHLPHSKHGWVYRYTNMDLDGKIVGTPSVYPMPVENQQFYSSGISPKCFSADTPIAISLTETRPISDIHVGDTVLAFDPAADLGRGALVPRKVVRLYRNTTEEWVRLTWAEGGEAKELIATPGHHFLDRFGSFPTIEEMLENGKATVVLSSGEPADITATRIEGSVAA